MVQELRLALLVLSLVLLGLGRDEVEVGKE